MSQIGREGAQRIAFEPVDRDTLPAMSGLHRAEPRDLGILFGHQQGAGGQINFQVVAEFIG